MFIEIGDGRELDFPTLYSAKVENFPEEFEYLHHEFGQYYTDKDSNMVIKRDSGFLRVVPLAEPPRYNPLSALKVDSDTIKSTLLQMVDLRTGRIVAAKRIFSPSGVIEEAEILQKVTHPNIVPYLDLATSGKGIRDPYIIMEWLSGGTLDDWIQSGRHQITEVASVFDQTSAAINHVNRVGYLYADAKPLNILFNEEGVVKLIDFENCFRLEEDGSCVPSFCLATRHYASPEQNKAAYECGGVRLYLQSDVYSLAAVLFDVLTRGSARFGAREDFVENGDFLLPLRPEYQEEIFVVKHRKLARILRRALIKNYQERQANVGVLNMEVQEVLG